MKSYQTLSVIGGVLGMIIVFLAAAITGFANSMVRSFGGTGVDTGQLKIQIAISIIFYMIAIVLPFVLKRTKLLGGILVGISFITLVSAGLFGVISFVLLLTAGIVAIRWKEKRVGTTIPRQKTNESALDVLKTRYAKGEITKEQFDEMKKDLE